ncbi:MAG TPA: hypothetical protein VFV95_15810 [Vicinamibacterales bacterium]|nr:hypothetical protein [Vicinamibacterales bacterium]
MRWTIDRYVVFGTPSFEQVLIEGFFDYGLPINGERPSEDRLIERIVECAPRFGIEVLGPSPL